MLIDLRDVTVDEFTTALFDHMPRAEPGDEPWYFAPDLRFAVDAGQQVANVTAVLQEAGKLIDRYSAAQIEEGLWCMLGGCWFDEFFGNVWNPSVAVERRLAAIESVYSLYDQLLAAPPYENIHFGLPDLLPRRYQTIDYMVTDLILMGRDRTPVATRRMRGACLRVFIRLLHHPAPVAQYSALHGLGHLNRAKGRAEIALYIAEHQDLSEDQIEYAHDAMRGDVL